MTDLPKENNFDLLRLILAFLVLLTHWNLLTGNQIEFFIFHLSGFAVDAFFVVSGFLIWWSFDSNTSIIPFYIKRFFRLYPLYFLLVCLQTLFLVYYSNGTNKENLDYFLSNLVFLNFLSPTSGTVFSNSPVDAVNGSLWTLKNEVVYYALVPVFHFLVRKSKVTTLIVLISLSIAYIFACDLFEITFLRNQFPGQLRLFIAGVLIYEVLRNKNFHRSMLVFLFATISTIFLYENVVFRTIFYPFFLSVIVYYCAFEFRPTKVHADFSYSLYIIHFPLIQIFALMSDGKIGDFQSFMLVLFVILFLAFLCERFIETPCINLGRKFSKLVKL